MGVWREQRSAQGKLNIQYLKEGGEKPQGKKEIQNIYGRREKRGGEYHGCQDMERSPTWEIFSWRIYSGHLLCNITPKTPRFLINGVLLFCVNILM